MLMVAGKLVDGFVSISFPLLSSLQGSHGEVVMMCSVRGMEEPLLLCLSADVHGLSVSYHVSPRTGREERWVRRVR